MNTKLLNTIQSFDANPLSEDRKTILDQLIALLMRNPDAHKLVFVCTHNSRRSQMAQAWAHVANDFYGLDWQCFSGGTEITAFNKNAIHALQTLGFEIGKVEKRENPKYNIQFDSDKKPIEMFSKKYTDSPNPTKNFVAIMNCSDAETNCPFVTGASAILSLKYDDPKIFDDTQFEESKYEETALKIGHELFYVFKNIASISKK